MRFGPAMAVLAAPLSSAGNPARAAACLDRSVTSEEIVDAMNDSRGCDRATKVFEDCEFGTSGDIRLGAAIEKKCEADFLSRLGAPQKRAHTSEFGRCDAKYRNENGAMYRSFTAIRDRR